MGNIGWILILLPCSILFTGIGLYALKREKPMWFWSGSTVKENEISDIRSYNRANGMMWISFSVPFWVSTILGYFYIKAGAIILISSCILGIPALPMVYEKIYKKYKR